MKMSPSCEPQQIPSLIERSTRIWTSADCTHPSPISTDSSAGIAYQHIASVKMNSDDFFYTSVENATQQGLVINPGTWDNKEMLDLEKNYFSRSIPWHPFEPMFKKYMRKNG